MSAAVHPWIDPSFALGTTAAFPQTDRYTDAGFDAQYQYQGNNYWFILRGSYIREYQNLAASFANGLSANRNNARIALDYIVYEKFDGTKLGASGNNTLFLSFWWAM